MLRTEGWKFNAKRLDRLWRQEIVKVTKTGVERRGLGSADCGIVRFKVESHHHIWSIEFLFDRPTNGRSLNVLFVIDEFTLEWLALEVGRKLAGEYLVEVLLVVFAIRGVPKFIRIDNGPEFASRRVRGFLELIDG